MMQAYFDWKSLFPVVLFLDSMPPLSSLRLLIPPLRLMSAFMWHVAEEQKLEHYEKLENFVSLVTKMVPDLLSHRQKATLLMGLRAKVRTPFQWCHHISAMGAFIFLWWCCCCWCFRCCWRCVEGIYLLIHRLSKLIYIKSNLLFQKLVDQNHFFFLLLFWSFPLW